MQILISGPVQPTRGCPLPVVSARCPDVVGLGVSSRNRPGASRILRPSVASAHQLPVGGCCPLRCPRWCVTISSVGRHLDLPSACRALVTSFVGSVVVVVRVQFVPLGLANAGLLQALAFALLFLPAWMIGFSIPVFTWWAVSSEVLHLPTDRRQGESMLIAGMLSGFPAIAINSLLFPMAIVALGVTSPGNIEGLTLVLSAPVGEEVCKFGAVVLLGRLVDSGRRGLQAGFTVGLGFAMIENLQYILASLLADPTTAAFGFGFTSVLRGVGSIPGHAVWTGLGGYALGCSRARSIPARVPQPRPPQHRRQGGASSKPILAEPSPRPHRCGPCVESVGRASSPQRRGLPLPCRCFHPCWWRWPSMPRGTERR